MVPVIGKSNHIVLLAESIRFKGEKSTQILVDLISIRLIIVDSEQVRELIKEIKNKCFKVFF